MKCLVSEVDIRTVSGRELMEAELDDLDDEGDVVLAIPTLIAKYRALGFSIE